MGTMAANDKYSGAVDLALAPSRIVAACIAAATVATLALVAVTPLRVDAAILLATAAACLACPALRAARTPRRLAVERGGAVSVDGVAGELRDGSFVAPWLAIVRWRPAGARFDRTVLVARDMLPPADFRHLRVLLRWR